jgi:cytoskeletal protein RodZ
MTEKNKGASPAPQNPDPSGAAERAGDILRSARESRGISIDEIAKKFKIHARHIEALESSRYDQLPGDPYIRVYLKTLSTFLSLHSEEILERFFKERGLTGVDTLRKDSSTKINLALREKPRPNLTLVIIGVLIAILAAFSFFANQRGWFSPSPASDAAADSVSQSAPAQNVAAGEGAPKDETAAADSAPATTDLKQGPAKKSAAPAPAGTAAALKEAADSLKQKSAGVRQQGDSLHNAASAVAAGTPAAAKDSVKPVPVPAASPAAAGTLKTIKDTLQKPRTSAARPLRDTLAKSITPDAAPVAVPLKDTAKSGAGSLWRPEDTVWPTKSKIDTTRKKTAAAPPAVPVQPSIPGSKITLRMTIVGDSCWARVFSDGRQWRNLLRKGRYKTFTAQDSLNVHVGVNEAVSFTVNGQQVNIPGSGVISFKVDHNGVTTWSLDKWNSVFRERY